MKYVFSLMLLVSNAFAGSPQGVPIMTNTTVGTSSTVALAANKDRGYLIVQNNGSSTCLISFGTAISGSEGLHIEAGQNYEPTTGFIKSAIYMKCNLASQPIQFAEANY